MPPKRISLEAAVNGLKERISGFTSLHHEIRQLDLGRLLQDEIIIRLDELDNDWGDISSIYYDICTKFTPEERQELQFFTENKYNQAKMQYRDAKLALRRQLTEDDRHSRASEQDGVNGESRSNSSVGRLQRIELPTFSGERAQWLTFRELFTSLVINTSLSNVDKFNYLKSCLKDNAQEIVKGLTVSEKSFDNAWSELTDRYDNKRLMKQTHSDALVVIAPVARAHDSREYERVLNQVHGNLMSLKGLDVCVDNWGELLLSVVKSKFDNTLLDDWERAVSVN